MRAANDKKSVGDNSGMEWLWWKIIYTMQVFPREWSFIRHSNICCSVASVIRDTFIRDTRLRTPPTVARITRDILQLSSWWLTIALINALIKMRRVSAYRENWILIPDAPRPEAGCKLAHKNFFFGNGSFLFVFPMLLTAVQQRCNYYS